MKVFMNGVPISFRRAMHKFVTLSVTDKIVAEVMVAQVMLYMYCLLEWLELNFKLPMVLKMENSGAADIANSWGVGGRTRHVNVHSYFL